MQIQETQIPENLVSSNMEAFNEANHQEALDNPYQKLEDYVDFLEKLPRRERRKHFKLRFSNVVKKQFKLK